MHIPFNQPTFFGTEKKYIYKSLESLKHCGNHHYSKKCRDYLIKKYGFLEVFLTTSCTTALEMGVLLCNIKPGDEVILPSYTFSSTANAFVLRGGIPVFCEINKATMNIDPQKIEALITDKTKLIMPIDYAGIPCDINKIKKIADKYKIPILQDSAQSFHSFHDTNEVCGAVPSLATYSFHETKNINCGEGGALIINDPALIERAHFLQEKGTDRSLVLKGLKNKYSWVDIGSSFLLSDILAAMLFDQIKNAEKTNKLRSIVTKAYYELFSPYSEKNLLSIPIIPKKTKVNNHAFFVIFNNETEQQKFINLLKEKNVHAYIGYLPLHSSPMGKKYGYEANHLKKTESLASRIVRLPMYNNLHHKENLNYCIKAMSETLKILFN